MARRNKPRSIGEEANLAERIRRERGERGWSPADLAKRMTSMGCSLTTSAVYKIEDRENPRRISVDELVALAQVLGTTVDDLLTPIEVLNKKRAQELLADLSAADGELMATVRKFLDAYRELFSLAADDPELFDYVKGHHYRLIPKPRADLPPGVEEGLDLFWSAALDKDTIDARDETHEFALRTAFGQIYLSLIGSADRYRQWNEKARELERSS